MFSVRCLRLFTVCYYVYVQYRDLEPGIDERHRFGRYSTSPADGRGVIWTWRCLSSLLHTLAKMTWVFISVSRFGVRLLLKIWHPVAICLLAPFQAFWKVSKWKTPTSLITGKHWLSSGCRSFKRADPAWPCLDWDLMSPWSKVVWQLSAGFANKQVLCFSLRMWFKFITSINKCLTCSNMDFTMLEFRLNCSTTNCDVTL